MSAGDGEGSDGDVDFAGVLDLGMLEWCVDDGVLLHSHSSDPHRGGVAGDGRPGR